MSRTSIIAPILGVSFGLAAPIFAAELPVTSEITITELVQRTMENNPQIAANHQFEKAASEQLKSLQAFPNPTLDLVPRLAGNKEASDSEILLSQPLDLFGKRHAEAAVQEAELQAMTHKSTFTRTWLANATKIAAVELYAAQESKRLSQEQVNIVQDFLNSANRRAELGDAPRVEAERAEIELLRAQNDVSNAQNKRLAKLEEVNELIGGGLEMDLHVASPMINLDFVPLEITLELRKRLLSTALQKRADLQEQQVKLQAQKAQIDVIKREKLPDVALQLRRSSLFGGEVKSYALRATINMPIFDFGSIQHRRRAAESTVKAQAANVRSTQNQVSRQVNQTLLQLVQQRQNLQQFHTEIVPRTQDLLRKTQIGYEQGASTYLDLLEAQRTAKQVQLEYLEALAGTLRAEANLENAIGAPLPQELSIFTNSEVVMLNE